MSYTNTIKIRFTISHEFYIYNITTVKNLGRIAHNVERKMIYLNMAKSSVNAETIIITHPVQASQVLHFVLVCVWVVVDDGVLFVHTARLHDTKSSQSLQSKLINSEF